MFFWYLWAKIFPKQPIRKSGSWPSGFGGWLMWLSFQVCVSPLIQLGNIAKEPAGAEAILRERFPHAWTGLLVCRVVAMLLMAALAVVMLRRKAIFPSAFAILTAGSILCHLVGHLWATASVAEETGHSFIEVSAILTTTDWWAWLVVTMIYYVAWTLYVMRSKRVANTFLQ